MTKNYKTYSTLNILFKNKDGEQRCLYLTFQERWGWGYDCGKVDYKYNRCIDTKGRKGLDRWINRTWERYYGQNALLDYLSKVQEELGQENYAKIYQLVYNTDVLASYSGFNGVIDIDKI